MGCTNSKVNKYVQAETNGRSVNQGPQHRPAQDESQSVKFPLRPPKKNKSDIIPDVTTFRQLEESVRRMPPLATRTVTSLAQFLVLLCNDDLQKVRAFFCWLAFNIAYDTTMLSGVRRSQKAEDVLQSRRAVCQGYAELFLALCKEAGIECLLVSGISKGYNYDPETVFTGDSKTDHAWNLVRVEGEWRPLDCTWGAGTVQDGIFKRKFAEHWFLTDPQEFLPKHFPLVDGNVKTSEAYQLVKRPIKVEQFSRLACPHAYAYTIGLQMLSHLNAIIDVTKEVKIAFKGNLEAVSASLTEKDPSGRLRQPKQRTGVMASLSSDGKCTILIRPPRVGSYKMQIMARGAGEEDTNIVNGVLDYVIKCHKTHSSPYQLPEIDGHWGLRNPSAADCRVKPPLKQSVTAKGGQAAVAVSMSRATTITAKLSHADGSNNDLANRTFVDYSHKKATVKVLLPEPGYYQLSIFAQDPNENATLPLVAEVLVFADQRWQGIPTFPAVYAEAHRERVQLLEPTVGEVAAGVRRRYRVRAPTLGMVKVGDMTMMMNRKQVWEAEVTPASGMTFIQICGARDRKSETLHVLYRFSVTAI